MMRMADQVVGRNTNKFLLRHFLLLAIYQSDDWPIAAAAIHPTTEGANAAADRPI